MSSIHLLKISRLEGLTDGIFAIAMTIIVLNLHIPAHLPDQGIMLLLNNDVYSYLLIYIGTFIILGTHWIAMNFQLGLLEHLNRLYLWANMFYLMAICIIPFSANLLGMYPDSVESIYFYAINLLCTSLGQLIILQSSRYYKLNKGIYTNEMYRATLFRIFLAPVFYFASLIISHWTTVGCFILLVAPTIIYIIPGKIDKYEFIAEKG